MEPTRTVLLVTDGPLRANDLRDELGELGLDADVLEARSAREAERFLASGNRRPDVLVVSLALGDGDGLDVVAAAREREGLASVPALVLATEDPGPDAATVRRLMDLRAGPFVRSGPEGLELAGDAAATVVQVLREPGRA